MTVLKIFSEGLRLLWKIFILSSFKRAKQQGQNVGKKIEKKGIKGGGRVRKVSEEDFT